MGPDSDVAIPRASYCSSSGRAGNPQLVATSATEVGGLLNSSPHRHSRNERAGCRNAPAGGRTATAARHFVCVDGAAPTDSASGQLSPRSRVPTTLADDLRQRRATDQLVEKSAGSAGAFRPTRPSRSWRFARQIRQRDRDLHPCRRVYAEAARSSSLLCRHGAARRRRAMWLLRQRWSSPSTCGGRRNLPVAQLSLGVGESVGFRSELGSQARR